MNAARYFADFIEALGVRHVYTLSGGMIAPLLDAIGEHKSLNLVAMSHEQSAAFAAETEGRLFERPGVAIGTSGPGAINLVSGIASAYFDSIPALYVGGQVQSYLEMLLPESRQSGLQQCDFAGMCAPIVKATYSPKKAPQIPEILTEAYRVSMSDRPGPVVVDFPLDVQMGEVQQVSIEVPKLPVTKSVSSGDVAGIVRDLYSAHRPILFVGGGARNCRRNFRKLSRTFRIPVVSTIAGLDVAAGLNNLQIGMCGMYGTRAANTVMSEADFVLILGSRVDHAVLGADPARFAQKRAVWHVDIDPAEAGKRMKIGNTLIADCNSVISTITKENKLSDFKAPQEWIRRVDAILESYNPSFERTGIKGIDPNSFFESLSKRSARARAFVVDAGHHTWYAAQSLKLNEKQRLISSTGLHACGTAIPASISAALNFREPIVAIVGDGSVQLNIQELATVVRDDLPIKTIVMNNRTHGSVRQLQTEISQGRFHASTWGLAEIDNTAIFNAYGIPAIRICESYEVENAIAWLWEEPSQPRMLEVAIETAIEVTPVVPFGRQISAMQPAKPPGGPSI